MTGFGFRNLKVFFKDKSAVFFSLIAVFIIIGLYVLFLGDVWTESLGELPGVRALMDNWIMAGLLAVTSVTTTMGAYGTMVQDREKKLVKDFKASPVSSHSIVGGYIVGAVVIGVMMSLITLILAELYILSGGGGLLPAMAALKVLGLIPVTTLCNSAIVLFIVSFFRSSNAFATASTIIGTVIGFLTGIYLPVGQLPAGVQWAVKLFPVSHGAALFRRVMMEGPLETSFAGAPAEAVTEFQDMMGVTIRFGDAEIGTAASLMILLATAAVFYALAIWKLSRKSG
ncbi:MAG: ABC transporter permease [Oscillospiraceae bacterium]|jgi:multidrug/hemolysin transport system permease protein|nr:ABC transporter permease [Oscillospiraceae bacterium]